MGHENKIRVLELYAGIGGMHFALKASGVDFEIIEAMEINPVVLSTYNHNFPAGQASARNIDAITADEINELDVDLIVMSPPCQPYCRTGKKLGIQDARSSSFVHLLNILANCKFKYLLLENVKGFETSDARDALIETLQKCEMSWQEFLLSPTDCQVPNSRLRYYLASVVADHFAEWEKYRSSADPETKDHVWCVGDIIAQNKDVCGDLESSGMSIGEKFDAMKLRYFSPREVARLMCFPDDFSFPQTLSNKQCYRALGNSINVYIVAILLSLLLADVSS